MCSAFALHALMSSSERCFPLSLRLDNYRLFACLIFLNFLFKLYGFSLV